MDLWLVEGLYCCNNTGGSVKERENGGSGKENPWTYITLSQKIKIKWKSPKDCLPTYVLQCSHTSVISVELGLKCCSTCFSFQPLKRYLRSSVGWLTCLSFASGSVLHLFSRVSSGDGLVLQHVPFGRTTCLLDVPENWDPASVRYSGDLEGRLLIRSPNPACPSSHSHAPQQVL